MATDTLPIKRTRFDFTPEKFNNPLYLTKNVKKILKIVLHILT